MAKWPKLHMGTTGLSYVGEGIGWGDWHSWQYCPGDSYAISFQTGVASILRYKKLRMYAEKVGLAGMRLICNDVQTTFITSGMFPMKVRIFNWVKLKTTDVQVWDWGKEPTRCKGGYDGSWALIQKDKVGSN